MANVPFFKLAKGLDFKDWIQDEKKEKEHKKSLEDGSMTIDEWAKDEIKEHDKKAKGQKVFKLL